MLPNVPDKVENAEIAQALVAVMESQDAIMRMLWSIKAGIPNPAFLEDSDFQLIKTRREMAKNALKSKYKIF